MSNRFTNPDISCWTKLKTQVYNSGHTAGAISLAAGVPWVRFSNAQTGQLKLTPAEYEKVAKVLSIHPIELIGFNDPDMEVVPVEEFKARNLRLRRERDAIRRLRLLNPDLYEQLINGDPSIFPVSNGSKHNIQDKVGSE